MPNCIAFKQSGLPCTNGAHPTVNGGLCGVHWHKNVPAAMERFAVNQAKYREAWEGIALGTHALNASGHVRRLAEAVAVPVAVLLCTAQKKGGSVCGKLATNGHLCGQHHAVEQRRMEDVAMRGVRRELRRRRRAGAGAPVLDALLTAMAPLLAGWALNRLEWEVDRMLTDDLNMQLDIQIHENGATQQQVEMLIAGWVEAGQLTERRAERVRAHGTLELLRRMVHRPVMGGREAHIAADTQNVHTPEISAQMRDSLEILLAVEVPVEQKNTVEEIVLSWEKFEVNAAVVQQVRADVVSWWNRKFVCVENDSLYKKVMRGLWWTIKTYKGEVREELEKRLWQECKEAALPYSVCAQGHLARLSNVMVGFDGAFVPPVAVGEILQQRMSAISEMDVPYEKQIELAEAVLAELKIPAEQHANWLSAF